jgi:hypothetical protein
MAYKLVNFAIISYLPISLCEYRPIYSMLQFISLIFLASIWCQKI